MTLDELAAILGRSPPQVGGEIRRLEQAGCRWCAHGGTGWKLEEAGLGTWADYLGWALGDARRLIRVYQQTASTQDVMRRFLEARDGRADGALALADAQTAGRGRLGRRWVAPPGTAVLLSRGCAQRGFGPPDRLALVAAVAVARAVETCVSGGERGIRNRYAEDPPGDSAMAPDPFFAQIKWPNDILIAGRKVAGILVESLDPQTAIIGVGLNVSLRPEHLSATMPELAQRITSLSLAGCAVDRLLAATALARELDRALAEPSLDSLLEEWRRRSILSGQTLTVAWDGQMLRGRALDLDPLEGLILQTSSGEIIHLHAAMTTIVSAG